MAGFADGAEPSVSFAVPFDLTSTQAAPVASSSVPTQAEPTRYYYGPGYYGYTYYAVPAPGVAVAAPVPMMSPPPASYSSGSGAFHDPSTGRDLPTSISKPWLRPY